MKKKIFLLLPFLLLYLRPLSASVEIRSNKLTTGDGLANNSIRYMMQDSKGFIWLGTLNGLSYYDGNSFVNIYPDIHHPLSLADSRIRSMEEDPNGFLWISTISSFISCYDLRHGCFVDFTGNGEYKENYSKFIISSDRSVWLWHNQNGCRRIVYQDGKFSSQTYKEKSGNLPSDKVQFVLESAQGEVWIGTDKGLLKYQNGRTDNLDPQEQSWEHIISYDKYTCIITDKNEIYRHTSSEGKLEKVASLAESFDDTSRVTGNFLLQDQWVLFTTAGSYSLDIPTGKLSRYAALNIKNGAVTRDNKKNVWVHNYTGDIWYINITTGEIKPFRFLSSQHIGYIDVERYSIVHDSRDILWISTYGNGLYAYELSTGNLQHFSFEVGQSSPINSNYLQFVMEDRSGGIWVSSEFSGLSHLEILNKGTQRLYPSGENSSDRSNTIRMLFQAQNNHIYLANRMGSLYEYDSSLTKVIRQEDFTHNVYSMNEDSEGNLWLGMRGTGLRIGAGQWYRNDSKNPHSLSNDQVYSIYRDRKGRMWLGTFGGGLNLAVKTAGGYEFRHFLQDNYSEKRIRVIEEDKNGRMWVGTNNGIYVFHPDSLIASPGNYILYNHANGTFPSNEIRCLMNDDKGNMWIGTAGAGFAVCRPEEDHYPHLTFDCYDIKDGLSHAVVQSIVQDKDHKMWIATEYGISRFTPATRQIENYFFSSYTLGNVYSENTACVSNDGKLLFGTNYGLVVLDADKIENLDKPASVIFTGLQINGAHMLPGAEDSPLQESVPYINELQLKYYQNSFMVSFSTFNYLDGVSKYSYSLPPYDTEWSSPSSLNFAMYRNLPPGKYRLHVKACNAAGIWGEENILEIVITPPFWKTAWAYLVYAILILIAGYFCFRIIRNFNALRNRIAVENQLTEYKLEFFTNISHEFRTPLTLIQGALEKIVHTGNHSRDMQHSLKIMDKSTKRMLRLINQLLEFRKMQKNKLALSLEETDIIAFCYEIFLSFKDVSESKNMDFRFEPSQDSYKMPVDKGNLDKVIYNLLSNAFKYTPSNGKIVFRVEVEEQKKQLRIQVTDTGLGIPKEKRTELFKRFMQSSFSHSSVGVGLHLTYGLVHIHKGTISYHENEGGGSVFTVELPADAGVYEEKDFLVPNQLLIEEEEQRHKELATGGPADEKPKIPAVPLNKRKVLIIEDDNDVREFLKEEIGQYFEVVAEADGISGFERAQTYDADLIICDVLMPGMTGFEVTKKLKNEFATSHIPVILLTALHMEEKYLEGIESGADAYITKPFSISLLLARISKLIEQRDKLREKFSNEPGIVHAAICTNNKDSKFLAKLNEILNEHMVETEFSVDDYANLMGLGRTVFYKKVRGVTGYSPNEYLRVIRLKKAAELLLTEDLTVAEISYQVGINDPYYFSKCFKNQFGIAPSVYQKNGGKVSVSADTSDRTGRAPEEKNQETGA